MMPITFDKPISDIIALLLCGLFLWRVHERRLKLRRTVATTTGSLEPELTSVTVLATPASARAPSATLIPASASGGTDKLKLVGWAAGGFILLVLAILFFRSDFFDAFSDFGPSSHHSKKVVTTTSSNAPVYSSVATLPGAADGNVVELTIHAPPNGKYDPENPDAALEGEWSADSADLISSGGNARKLYFNPDHSLPDGWPKDTPWVAKCYSVEWGDKPFIFNGSDAPHYTHCFFASKTDQPVNVTAWIKPN